MFEPSPSARADLKSGTLYAVSGEQGWIYFGQVTPQKMIGFFRQRALAVPSAREILLKPIMAVVSVAYPSMTKALRSGVWTKLGRFDLAPGLMHEWPSVLCPVGTADVEVHTSDSEYTTRIEDPAIQDMEVAAVWDAVDHIPGRLTADFGLEEAAWHVSGPVWRQRLVAQEFARRFPEAPWHALPEGWVAIHK